MPLAATIISADLAPFVFDPKIGFAVVVVTTLNTRPGPADLETGTVQARVVETLRPDLPRANSTVSFAFARDADEMARLTNVINTWNSLPLEPGSRLLLAWAPADAAGAEYAVAAASSDADPTSPDVVELREAIAIQALPPGSPQRRERLAEALVAGKGILRRYACGAAGPRQLVSRDEGVAMLSAAIGSARTGPDDDLALAETLMDPPLLDPDKGDDDANAVALTTLAHGFVRADNGHAGQWFRFLYSRVMCELSDDPDEDRSRRRDMLRAIAVEAATLSARLKEHGAAHAADAGAASELLVEWEQARKG